MKAALLLAACLLTWGQAVWGHAALVSAEPASGSVLAHAPAAVDLRFSEPVSVTALRLLGPDGTAVDVAPAEAGGTQIQVPWPADTVPGGYLLSWRVVSADGHPVGGTLDYAVGTAAPPAPVAHAAATPAGRMAAIWLGRWLGYVCLFACVGAALFRARKPTVPQAWARPLVWVGLGLLPVNLALQGLDLLDLPASALGRWAVWESALGSPYAWTLGLLAASLLAAWAALRTGALRVGAYAACALVLAGVALAASGHAGTAPPQWLSRPLVALHVFMAVAWLGALVPLVRLLGIGLQGRGDLSSLAWFSRWIVPAVGLLLLSGLGLVWLQLDQPADLWRTAYGLVLSVKLALVCGLFVIAAYNRRCTGPALSGRPDACGRLRRSILIETGLALVLLAVVSCWRFTPPPRSLDAAHESAAVGATPAQAAFRLSNDRAQAEVQRAADEWTIQLSDTDGKPMQAQALTLALDNPEAGIEPLRRQAQRLPDGRWRVGIGALPLTAQGHWRLRLDILVDDFDQVTLDGQLPS